MNHVEELCLEDRFDLDEIESLPAFNVPTFFTFTEAETFDSTLCTYAITVVNEIPYNGVLCYALSPMGLCGTHSRFTDGGTHIQNYLEALNLVDFSPYLHPFRFYDWSWHGGRDLRGTGREFIYQGEAFGDSGFGNFTPAYALTIRYGVVQANIFLAGANMMGFMQSWFIDKDGSIFKAYFDTQGRKAFQRVGINAAVKRIGGQ